MVEESDEKIRLKVKKSVFAAFDKFGARNFKLKSDPDLQKKDPALYSRLRLEDLFESKRAFILGFFRHVTKQVRNSADYQRQIATVTKAGLHTILNPQGVTIGELESKSEAGQMYTRRHIQDLVRGTYQDLFFRSESPSRHDGNVRPFSSIFAIDREPPTWDTPALRQMQAEDMLRLKSNPRMMEWLSLNAEIQPVFPEVLESVASFMKLCSKLLLEVQERTPRWKVLAEEFSKFTETFQWFHNHMLSIVSVTWFNGRSEKMRKDLIHDGFPFHYTAEDAARARVILMDLLGSPDMVADRLLYSASALKAYGSQEAALFIQKEGLKVPNLGHWHSGLLHENIAVIHRESSHPKLMVIEMKQAIAEYGHLPDKERLAVALKNLGEAEWNLGHQDLGGKYFREAEEFSNSLEPEGRAGVLWNLSYAMRRLRQPLLEKKYLVKCLMACPEERTELILEVDRRLSELS